MFFEYAQTRVAEHNHFTTHVLLRYFRYPSVVDGLSPWGMQAHPERYSTKHEMQPKYSLPSFHSVISPVDHSLPTLQCDRFSFPTHDSTIQKPWTVSAKTAPDRMNGLVRDERAGGQDRRRGGRACGGWAARKAAAAAS
ncbi:hypothetical protein BO86DRAFT_375148 [Aspergillus japonicus CBS 114.51]|uniref:Uncharacterized protein n=2 Tax=Aspergillus TaxID=5052 RepID=A0A2V5HCF4_ASPV1|nr:hypothetical protein BO86DRAFT_375148 [Aspergillus japonicus CBS 114.51]PYI22028.1 hypothetical protein BO99DRAFT_410389 [Aspergillus violaceofuscus CBS 115571]RAH86368.1 hypothetical protein BO86DRAFT_375148 [Aspergillus japonicus CBS 114.51]